MNSSCVRKGAWSGEEDLLLRKCIETYGQGKWHLVPQRAGLNRCRKSCRLRWLNYLQPNLNREGFKEDEIDLIVKMHKLLGNRWSLIAGRLPGRTANDIKNYWNSHLSKKFGSKPNESPSQPFKWKRAEVIRPKPRSFSSKVPSQGRIRTNMIKSQQQQEEPRELCMLTPSDTQNMWWNEFLLEDDKDLSWNSCDTNEEELLKDYTKEKTFEAMDPESVKFDRGISEWVDLLVRDD